MDVTFTCICHYQGMAPAPDVFVPPLTPWMSSTISLEGGIPRALAPGSVVNLLVGTCLGGNLGNQPQVSQLSNGRRGDRECLGLLHWKAVEDLGT